MLFDRERLIALEEGRLAPYAQKARDTRGRAHPEPESRYRTPYQKDRDRILHTTAFRRLEYKTQVFPNWAGDYYRTRLTHTLEVVQVARSIARALGLNEDLTEAIALSHDLGHPPFGHTGEKVLDELMREEGGFEHNAQALRILTHLEERYPGFRGLNLTYEVLEGIATHETAYAPTFKPLYEGQGTLEAQVVDLSDAIAYAAHDLDDGLRSGLLRPEDLGEVPLLKALALEEGLSLFSLNELGRRVLIRQLLGYLITDATEATHKKVEESGVQSAEAVRRHPERLAGLSPEGEKALRGAQGLPHGEALPPPQGPGGKAQGGDRPHRALPHLRPLPGDPAQGGPGPHGGRGPAGGLRLPGGDDGPLRPGGLPPPLPLGVDW
jgi:dGTPase